jgi:hypothetical protein
MVRRSMPTRGTLSVAERTNGETVAGSGSNSRQMSTWRKIVIGVLLLILAAFTIPRLVVLALGGDPESTDVSFQRLTGTGAKLANGRTARIVFTGDLKPVVAGPSVQWAGKIEVDFAAKSAWLSTYDSIVSPGQPTIQAKVVYTDSQTLMTRPRSLSPTADPG